MMDERMVESCVEKVLERKEQERSRKKWQLFAVVVAFVSYTLLIVTLGILFAGFTGWMLVGSVLYAVVTSPILAMSVYGVVVSFEGDD